MRYLRPHRSGTVPGVGYAHAGDITSVPNELAGELLATGEWDDVESPTPARVTEVPAPVTAQPPRAKKGR